MANDGGIWRLLLTTRNEIPSAVEKDIAALNRLERKSVQSGGVMSKALGRAGRGLGVSEGLIGSGGGGLGASLGLAAAFAVGMGFRALAKEAMDADVAAQNAAKSIREQYKLSAAATESLNEISLSGVKATSMFKAAFGELVATIVASAKYLGAAGLNVGARFGRALGIDMGPTETVVEDMLTRFFQNAPGFMGGVGGSGEGGVAAAQVMLDKAQKKRAEEDSKAVRTPTQRPQFTPNLDEFARMGLYLGGRGNGEATQLMREQKAQLELLNRKMADLAPQIAANL